MSKTKVIKRDNFFSSVAYLYDLNLRLNGYYEATNYMMKQLPFKRNANIKVLDIGCGTGLYSLAVLKTFPRAEIVAFDFNKEMVTVSKNNLNNFGNRVTIFKGDVLDKNISLSKKFDLIITGGVLEYVDINEAIKNMRGFLVNNGYFLNAPVKNNLISRLIGRLCYFKPYSKAKNIESFELNGFILRKVVAIPWYLPITLVKEGHLFIIR